MGLTPLGRKWPEGYEPTEEDWANYQHYLAGMLVQTRAQMRVSLRVFAAAVFFCAAAALVWWLT